MILMLILTLVNLMQCASGCNTCSDCLCHYENGEYSAYCLEQEVHQCGNSCIRHSEPCNGTCLRDGDWICDGDTEPECYPLLDICNGRKDGYYGTCSNVFKECPECPEHIAVVQAPDNSLICQDTPYNGTCISSPGLKWRLCGNKCINEFQDCDGECSQEGQLKVYCKEGDGYQTCRTEDYPCGGKCPDPTLVWVPADDICIPESDCVPEGPIDRARHLCNGLCIPSFVPCNGKCLDTVLWRTNRRSKLFGPVNCLENSRNVRRGPRRWNEKIRSSLVCTVNTSSVEIL